MITPKKFFSLQPDLRLRKLLRLFRSHELALRKDPQGQATEIIAIIEYGLQHQLWMGTLAHHAEDKLLPLLVQLTSEPDNAFVVQRMVLMLSALCHEEAAEWDLEPLARRLLGKAPGLMVFAEDLRSPFNIGSVFRTAEVFGFSRVLLSTACAGVTNPRLLRSAMGSTERIKWQQCELESFLEQTKLPVFALELGGTPIHDFEFPQCGVLIIGSEELGISPQRLTMAQASAGIASIPCYGSKASLNVATSFGIIAHAWTQSVMHSSLCSPA